MSTSEICRVELCHGNGPDEFDTFEADTFDEALAWVREQEERRHPGRSVLDAEFAYRGSTFTQFGTDYHWVSIERVAS